jgi:hypothetical protein
MAKSAAKKSAAKPEENSTEETTTKKAKKPRGVEVDGKIYDPAENFTPEDFETTALWEEYRRKVRHYNKVQYYAKQDRIAKAV